MRPLSDTAIRGGGRLLAAGMLLASLLRPCLAAEPSASPVPSPGAERGPSASPAGGFDPMSQLSLGSGKEPIQISADQLDFDWQNDKVVYRGKVHATQGDLVIESDTLTINFLRPDAKSGPGKPGAKGAAGAGSKPEPVATAEPGSKPGPGGDGKADGVGLPRRAPSLRDVVAEGHVVITQKGRRATGGVAVFSQQLRQLVLGGDPVLRDGPNEVAGDRIIVYIDEGRSVVESSGSKRVTAVLYPGSEKGLGADGKPREKADAKPREKNEPGSSR